MHSLHQQDLQDETQIKKKHIMFRNPYTKQIIAQVQIPNFVQITNSQVGSLASLRNKLRMLYIDVLYRGYHPMKGFQLSARNIFHPVDIEQKVKSKTAKLVSISNYEAVSTIWRCLGREVGRPIKNYNFAQVYKQVFQQLDKIKSTGLIDLNFIYQMGMQNQNEVVEYEQLLGQLESIKQDIRLQMKKIQIKCNRSAQKLVKSHKLVSKLMGEQILQLQKQVFIKSIVGIKKCQTNKLYIDIILEQSYPIVRMLKKKATQCLGQKLLNQKQQQYIKYINTYKIPHEDIGKTEPLLFCHYCLTPLNAFANIAYCDDSAARPKLSSLLMTDPYVYNKIILNQNCWDTEERKYIHPYLSYYSLNNAQQRYVCNRYFCNKCKGFECSVQTGKCNYCAGICECKRCQGMDMLTSMMGIYIDNRGDFENLTNKFMMKFQTNKLQIAQKDSKISKQATTEAFDQYVQSFVQNQIFTKKADMHSYEQIQYFSTKLFDADITKDQIYKINKLKLAEAESQRRQRKQKELQAQQQYNKINNKLKSLKNSSKQQTKSKKMQLAEHNKPKKQQLNRDQNYQRISDSSGQKAEKNNYFYDDSSS